MKPRIFFFLIVLFTLVVVESKAAAQPPIVMPPDTVEPPQPNENTIIFSVMIDPESPYGFSVHTGDETERTPLVAQSVAELQEMISQRVSDFSDENPEMDSVRIEADGGLAYRDVMIVIEAISVAEPKPTLQIKIRANPDQPQE